MMDILITVVILIVALLHFYIMYFEMLPSRNQEH